MASICSFYTKDGVFIVGLRDIFASVFSPFNGSSKNPKDVSGTSAQSDSDDKLSTIDPELSKVIKEEVSKSYADLLKNSESRSKSKNFLAQFLPATAAAIVSSLVISAILIPKQHAEINGNIAELKAIIVGQTSAMTQLQENIRQQFEGLNGMQQVLATSIFNLDYNSTAAKTGLISTALLSDSINFAFNNRDSACVFQVQAVYNDADSVLALDSKTGQKYTADDLSSQKLLVPYQNASENEDVYFYGQFDDNGYWDGDCIINIYEDGNLKLIVDAEYSSGKMLYSQQVFHYEMPHSNNHDVWAISNRKVIYNLDGSIKYSSGDTKLYNRYGDFYQKFEADNVTEADILSVAQFYKDTELDLYAYYFGNTSNGYFNDNTGNSYMIYFFDDYTVSKLYFGDFADGTMNDDTGNAWWIVEDKPTQSGCYGYYKGRFKNGIAIDDYTKNYEYNIPQERIDQIVAETGKIFAYELRWRTPADYGFNNQI